MKKQPNGTGTIQNGYRWFNLSTGRIPEHRLVMEKHLGRPLEKFEVVHHINGNRLDNRVENLLIMTRGSHNSHHYRKDFKERVKKIRNSYSKIYNWDYDKSTQRPEPCFEGQKWRDSEKKKWYIVFRCSKCSSLLWRIKYQKSILCIACYTHKPSE
jgi:hypothetical protein